MSDTSNIGFVRHEPIPPSPPPVTETGVFKWIRENLFSNIINSVLTILSVYFIIHILLSTMPWILNGVWTTNSLRSCRDVLDGTSGACWSVLTERWNQLLFGFQYPTEGYWRPTLAFVLLLISIAPVLFNKLPRKMLILTFLFPFIAYWLIWGGTIWVPLLLLAIIGATAATFVNVNNLRSGSIRLVLGAIVGVIITALTMWMMYNASLYLANIHVMTSPEGGVERSTLGSIMALIGTAVRGIIFLLSWAMFLLAIPFSLFVGYMIFVTRDNDSFGMMATLLVFFGLALFVLMPAANGINSIIPIALESVPSRALGGFMVNMILGAVCVSLSIPLGIALALGRQSKLPIVKAFSVIFIEFIRGVPLITLLFVANVVLNYFFPLGSNSDLFLRVIIVITMFSAAYIAEVIRGGLAALPRGQYEAADSLGLDYPQAMRLIILPQALKISIPGIVNVAVGLFKDTTLVSVISMFDLVGMIRGPVMSSTAWTGIYWELFLFAIVLFFVVCYGISQYSQWLERQLRTDHH